MDFLTDETDTVIAVFDDFCDFADRCVFFLEAAACVHRLDDGMNADARDGLYRQATLMQTEIRALQMRLRSVTVGDAR
ncbi:MAG: hypothetical protein K0U93_22925 [Gammaproteobacteria bacterium]|nr:hypothetical protein [Gammaproteobacteria bacterium]